MAHNVSGLKPQDERGQGSPLKVIERALHPVGTRDRALVFQERISRAVLLNSPSRKCRSQRAQEMSESSKEPTINRNESKNPFCEHEAGAGAMGVWRVPVPGGVMPPLTKLLIPLTASPPPLDPRPWLGKKDTYVQGLYNL